LEFKIIKADSKTLLIIWVKLKEIYLIRFQRIKAVIKKMVFWLALSPITTYI